MVQLHTRPVCDISKYHFLFRIGKMKQTLLQISVDSQIHFRFQCLRWSDAMNLLLSCEYIHHLQEKQCINEENG